MKKNTKFIIGMATALAITGILAGCGSKKYKITFVPNTSKAIPALEIDWGQVPQMPESPTKPGYTFTGWFTDAGCQNPYTPAAVENDFTLYAGWSINTYSVNFVTGVEGLEIPSLSVKYGSKFSVKNDIKRDYFTFQAWYYDQEFNKAYDPNDTMPGNNINLYAKWLENKFTITFNSNSDKATGTMDAQTIGETSASKALNLNKFKLEGYDFAGWSTTPDGKVEYTDGQDLVHVKDNNNFTLYAVWKVKSVKVKFFALNGDSLATVDDVPEVEFGQKVVIPEKDPECLGYVFKGWGDMNLTSDVNAHFEKVYYKKSGETFVRAEVVEGEDISSKGYYEVGIVDMSTRLVDLNSKYYANFNRAKTAIKFVESIDGVKGNEIVVKEGYYESYVSFTEIDKPAMPGYKVGGWYLDEACHNLVPGNGVKFADSDLTIYLKYDHALYKLRYSLNNGDSFVDKIGDEPITRYYNDDLALPEPSKTGYKFLGWSLEKDSKEIYDGKMPDGNLDVYAVFEAKNYTIKLHGGDGDTTLNFGYGDELSLPNSSKFGYTFNGWFKDAECTIPFEEARMPDTETIELWAKFTANEHYVSFDTLGGSHIDTINGVKFGTKLSELSIPEPTKTGYNFIGWVDKNGESFNLETEVMLDENIVLYANYEAKQYSVVVHNFDGTSTNVPTVFGQEIDFGTPKQYGYTFGGWFSDASFTNKFENKVMPDIENLELWPKFVANTHNISFDTNGGSPIETISNVKFGTEFKTLDIEEPVKEGYVFNCWTDQDGTIVDLNNYKMDDKDVLLLANYDADLVNVKVTYFGKDLTGGNYSKLDEEVKSAYTDSSFSISESDAKAFNGFEYESSDTVTVLANGSSEIGVYYTRSIYDVTFRAPEHEDIVVQVQFNDRIASIPDELSKTGYKQIFKVDGEIIDNILAYVVTGDVIIEIEYEALPQSVTFNANGGTINGLASDYLRLSTDEVVDFPDGSTTVRQGYTLLGWSLVKDGEVIDYEYHMPAESVQLYAVWQINQYKLQFATNHGTKPADIDANYLQEVALPSISDATGYTFNGFVNGAGQAVKGNTYQMPLGGDTLTAQWIENSVKIVFHGNGSTSGSMSDQTIMYLGSKAINANGFAKTGYSFAGWATSAAGEVVYENEADLVDAFDAQTKTIDLYAVWSVNSYNISFVSEHGEAPSQITAAYGSQVTIPAMSDVEGYTFDGYKNSNNDDVIGNTYQMPLNGDTFTAKWREDSVKIVFNGNGSEDGSMAEQTIMYTGSKAIRANAFTKTGYSFAGWATSAKGEVVYADGADLSVTFNQLSQTIDLYAVWSVNSYTITFDSNGGTEVGSITKDFGELFDAPKSPTRKGYTFVGWYTQAVGGDIVYPERMGAQNVTYYAHWQSNSYSVIFDSNGGSPIDSLEKTQGYKLTASDFPTSEPTREGYTFIGWFEKDGTYDAEGNPNSDWGNKITAENISSYSIDGNDVTFHAQWAVKIHTVTYYVDDSVFGTPETYKYGDAITKPADPTLDPGNTFLGWSTSSTEAIYFDFASEGFMGDADIKLYAVISEDKYTIQFIVDGVTVYSLPSDSSDPSFMAYIKKLYGETEALQAIYQAIIDAVTAQTSEGTAGSISPITAVITYATVGGQPNPGLYFLATQSRTSEALAQYALNTLGGVYGTANENDYYTDILRAADALTNFQEMIDEFTEKAESDVSYLTLLGAINSALAGDPTALDSLVADTTLPEAFRADVLRAASLLQDVQALLGELQGKAASDQVYVAILSAINEAMNGSADHITALGTYATIAKTYSRQELLAMFAVAQGATADDAARIVGLLEEKLPYAENAVYYSLIVESGAADMESISNGTSEILNTKRKELLAYNANANNPVPLVDGRYFDGWSEDVYTSSHTINYNAQWVYREDSIDDIRVSAVSTSSATFEWDEVSGCYGYRIQVIDTTTGEQILSNVTQETSYKVNGLTKGQSLKVIVTVLKMGSNGEYRAESKGYSSTSVITGETIVVSPSSLDSVPYDISYVHTVEDDIGKVSKVGDYFYVKESEGQVTYIFFTNTTYGFANRTLEIVTPGAGVYEVGKSKSGAPAIITNNETGTFYFTINGEMTTGIVRPMPDSFDIGVNFKKSLNATVQPNAKDRDAFESHDFLGAKKDSYKIGAATETIVSGAEYNYSEEGNKYFNGFKFDVNTLSSTGKNIKVERLYKFYKINGSSRVEVTNPDSLFFYDSVNDVFYFKKGATGGAGDESNLGSYEVEIIAKPDSGSDYVNTYIPKAIKEDARKMARFNTVIPFELVKGTNVYTSEGLTAAMADKNTSAINIQTNIKAELASNMYAYVPHIKDVKELRTDILNWKDSDTEATTTGLKRGEVDIVDKSAVMTTEDGYGPKIFSYTFSSTLAFVDKEGKNVYYAGEDAGTLAIKYAKFEQNFDDGDFKILAQSPQEGSDKLYTQHGLRTAHMFQRVGTGNVPLSINGNYYDINAKDGLFVRSANKNKAGTKLATYEIQSCHQTIFLNCSNAEVSMKNMNIIGNSTNVSALLGQDSKNVPEIMRMTSGGLNGIMSTDYNGSVRTKFNLESINITGTLIAIYADEGLNAQYCHASDSWANGLFAYCENSVNISISNSVIESSGGCAFHVDDQVYTLEEDGSGTVTNPTAIIDFSSCTIENFVCGDEQWFKGYSMELLALGLKSTINKLVDPLGLTIIKKMDGEYMNWEFFTKTDNIDNQGGKDPSDMTTYMNFGPSFSKKDTVANLGLKDALIPMIGEEAAKMFGNAMVYIDYSSINPATGQGKAIVMLNMSSTTYGDQPTLICNGNTQAIIVEATIQVDGLGNLVDFDLGQMHLFFRQSEDLIGWIQGMVELFIKK